MTTGENNYTIKEFLAHSIDDMKATIEEIRDDIKEIKNQTINTSDRVNSLENHKAYLWGSITVVTFLGGAIIGLSIMAIDVKIERGITKALEELVSTVQYEK